MSWLENRVRMVGLRQLLLGLLVAGAPAALVGENHKLVSGYFNGVATVSGQDLLALKSADDIKQPWIEHTAEKIVDTGVDIITVTKRRGIETGRSVTGHYFVASVGEKYLLIQADTGFAPGNDRKIEGLLEPIKNDKLDRLMQGQSPQVFARFLPVMLHAEDVQSHAITQLMLIGAAVLATLGLLGWALNRILRPRKHPALVALASSSSPDVAAVGSQVAADIKTGNQLKLGGWRLFWMRLGQNTSLTPTHLIKRGGLKFDIAPLADVLWACPTVKTKKMLGFIPVSKEYSTAFHTLGRSWSVGHKQAKTEPVFEHLARYAPWILRGHSDELEAMYKKNRAQLAVIVADRRAQSMPPGAGT